MMTTKNILRKPVSILMFFMTFAVYGQDDCATATTVTDLTGVVCATSSPGSTEVLVGSDCEEGTIDTWFQFTAQGGTADITVSSDVNGFRPEFIILGSNTNNCSPLLGLFDNLGCVDLNGNYTSISTTQNGLVAGNTYWVVVTSNDDVVSGTISVCVDNPVAVAGCVDNQDCSTPQVLVLPASDAGNVCVNDCNDGATVGPNFAGDVCADHLGPTVWYQFTTDALQATIDVSLTSTDMSTPHFSIFSTTDCSTFNPGFACVQGTGGSATVTDYAGLSANTTYYIAVSGDVGGDGEFDLCIEQFTDNSPCNTTSEITETGSSDPATPLGGPYSPGETVSFCYNITDWQTGLNCNYLQGIVPTFGNGWDPASLDVNGMPVAITTPLVTAGLNGNIAPGNDACENAPAGTWSWYNAGVVEYNDLGGAGALPAFTPLSAGWFFVTAYDSWEYQNNGFIWVCPNTHLDPNDNFGDNALNGCGNNVLDWDVCFDMIAGPIGNCTSGLTDLSVSIQTYADGEIGAWNDVGCVGNVPQTHIANLLCCPTFITADTVVCDNFTLPEITGDLLSGNEIYSDAIAGGGVVYNELDVLTIAEWPAAGYMYIYDGSEPGCLSQDSFLLEINVTPIITPITNLIECDSIELQVITGALSTGGNAAYYDASGGVAGGGNVYTAGDWITGSMTMYAYDSTTSLPTCFDEESFLITISITPILTLQDTTICSPNTVNLTDVTYWSNSESVAMNWFSDPGLTISIADVTSLGAGTYYVEAGPLGCTVDGSVTVTVTPTPILTLQDSTVCSPNTVNLTDVTYWSNSESVAMNWFSDPGLTISIADVTSLGAGTYYVEAGPLGCAVDGSVTITVTPTPIPILTLQDSTVCSPNTVDIGDATYWSSDQGALTWYSDAGYTTLLGSTDVGSGTYYAEYDNSGCVSQGSATIIINAIPSAPLAGTDSEYCSTVPFADMTAAGDGGTMTWYGDAGLTSVIATGVNLAPTNTEGITTYYVTETLNGCESPASQVIITVNDCKITVPTAFTPDGDLTNDSWNILDIDMTYPENIVYVYNRWGNLLFTSIQGDYANSMWDGTYKGKDLPVGSYYFIIEFNNEESEKTNGVVSIILNK